jgi:hypothetical protein
VSTKRFSSAESIYYRRASTKSRSVYISFEIFSAPPYMTATFRLLLVLVVVQKIKKFITSLVRYAFCS